jgi:hypothetical protein
MEVSKLAAGWLASNMRGNMAHWLLLLATGYC